MFPLGVLRSRQQQGGYNPNLCFGLYHFDGAWGGTVFSDSSVASRTLNGEGGLLWNTGKFGNSSLRLPDDVYDQAYAANSAAYNINDSDFTFELFFLFDFSVGSQYKGLIANADNPSAKDWQLYLNSQKIEFGVNLSADGWVTIQHQDDALDSSLGWNYVKVVRKNGIIKIGLNGVESNSVINCGSQSVSSLASYFIVGGMYDSSPYNGLYPNGYIDELRLNKQAVDGWSVPTAPFAS